MAVKSRKHKSSWGESLFNIFNKCALTIFSLFLVYPFYISVILSFNEGIDARSGGIYLWPRVFTLDNYKFIFQSGDFVSAAFISVGRTAMGTVVAVVFTAMYGYALSKKELVLRKFYLTIGLITMYFNGGLIPFYILIRNLKLYDNFLVYILPLMFSMFNAVIFMTFFRSVPSSLDESARIDGASYITIFFRIILPVSTPVFAAIAIFTAVLQWNSWFDTMLYTKSTSLRTLTFFFTQIVMKEAFYENVGSKMGGAAGQAINQRSFTGASLQMASMVIASVPILLIYPFLQKYFVKGIMIGSIKG